MKQKRDIDQTVAILLGEKQSTVSTITRAFYKEVMRLLIEESEVRIDGFGRFKLTKERGVRQPLEMTKGTWKKGETAGKNLVVVATRYKVYFSKAPPFRQALYEALGARKEKAMEKYAVDENVDQEQMEKASAQGCPECGSKVERHGNIVSCPKCGTEPFEKKRKKT